MKKILIVDDNQNNRLTLDLLLEDVENIEVEEAQDGQEALDKCKEVFYDLIFMDIMMPGIDGIETTAEIKKISNKSMIIALSALDDKESKQKMLLAGAEDYLTKPIDSDIFSQRTNNYLNIIELRKKDILNQDAVNPFSTSVFDRRTTFFIKNENSIVQFWDYFLQANMLNCENCSDYIRLIYGFSKWLIKCKKTFTIQLEESVQHIYLMLDKIDTIKKTTVHNIITKHMPETIFTIQKGTLTFKLTKIEESEKSSVVLSDDTKEILSKTHLDNPTAAEYVANTAISILPKIDSLENLENKISDLLISFENKKTKEALDLACVKFKEYVEVIKLLVEFEHLAFAINSLIEFLESIEEDKIQNTDLKNLISQLLNFLNDLTYWREIIFIKEEAIDIHYLDASLLSSCIQIEASFDDKEIDDGDDLEFF